MAKRHSTFFRLQKTAHNHSNSLKNALVSSCVTVKWQFIYARKVSIAELREFTVTWVEGATRGRATEMRVLLRDYVELLILTGMRHGTEAMRIRWRHCDWYVDAEGQRYLRIWVSGKTGRSC